MDETTQQVVEDNNLSAPTEEQTLAEQTSNEEPVQNEQAAETSETSEPSETTEEPAEQREVKRQPRVERRFDQMTKKMADMSKQLQPQASQYIPQVEMPTIDYGMEYSPEELDDITTQKAGIIAQTQVAQLASQLQASSNVQTYLANLNEDMASLRSQTSLLDPESADYDPDLEQAIVEEYEGRNPIEVNGRYNPAVQTDFRLRDVAKKHIANVERYRQKGQTDTLQNQQAAQDDAVITPLGGNTVSSGAETLDEMRERLANVKF